MKSKYYAIDENNKVIWAGDHIKYVKSKVEEDIEMTAHIYGWEALGDEFFTMAAARIISGRRIVAAYYYRKGWETASGPASAGMLNAVKSHVEKWEKNAEQIQMDFNARKVEERPETISSGAAPETAAQAEPETAPEAAALPVVESAALPVETRETNYAPIEIYLADHEKKTLSRVGVADNKKDFFEIMQYLIDSTKDKFDDNVAVRDTFSGNYISVKWIREKYGLRARTFDERMENVQTWAEPEAPETEPETVAQAEPEAVEERPETISEEETAPKMTPEELKEFHDNWKRERLAAIPDPDIREKVASVLAAFPAVYDRLYKEDTEGRADYSEDVALFEAWMQTPVCREFIGYCANVRGDIFSSDREAAAFVAACRECKARREEERPETISEEEAAPEAAQAEPEAAEAEPEAQEEGRAAGYKPARGPVKPKDFTAEALTGRGWCIVFDSGMNRTRVIVQDGIRETVAPIIEKAGFWWSDNMKSYNRKLTHKAHRAAVALAERLREAVAG